MALSAGQGRGEANDNTAATHPEEQSPDAPAATGCNDPAEHPPESKTPPGVVNIHAVPLSGVMEAYAVCRLVYDHDGAACDWVFLDINQAFLDLLAIPDPTGRRITEVSPGINERAPDILALCAQVVASGRPERVERRSPRSGKWLDVRVASLGSDHFLTVFEDISERKEAEEALRVTQTTVDWAPDLVQWIDTEGRVIYVNEANSRLLGYTREELEGMHVWDLDPNMSPERFHDDWRKTAAGGQGLKETVLRDKAGRDHPVEVSSVAVEIGDRHFGITFIRDIEERKLSEDVLARTRFSLDHIGDYPIWLDRTGRVVEVSESTCRNLGYSREELLSMTIFELDPVTPGHPQEVAAEQYESRWRRFEELGSVVIETMHRTKSGELIPVEVSITYESFGGETYQCSFCRDISKRKALAESLRATQISVEHSPDLVHWLDETGRIVYANEATCRLLHYSKEELESLCLWDIDPDLTPETFRRRWRDSVKNEGVFYYEARLQGKDGQRHAVEISHTFVELEGKPFWAVFARDITERRKTEEKLRLTQHALDRIADYPIWVAPGGRIFEVSESTCRHLEYSREELLSMSIFDIDATVDTKNLGKSREELLTVWSPYKQGDAFILLTRHRTKSGKEIPVEISLSFVTFEGVDYQCSFCRDISERKRLEESLYMTQVSVDRSADMIHWADPDGRIVYANQAMADALGYTFEELRELHLWDTVPEITPENFVERWSNAAAQPSLLHEGSGLTRNGREFPVEVRTSIVEFGGRSLAVSVARDISERKAAEEKLQRAQYALDHMADYVIWLDVDGRISEVSETACRQLGFSREELLRMTAEDIDPDTPPERWAEYWRTYTDSDPHLVEAYHRRKNGESFPVEIAASRVTFGGKQYDVEFCRDVSERKHLEETLRLTHYSVENATDLIHWADSEGRIAYANETARRYNGYTLEEIQKLHIWDIDANMTEERWPAAWEEVGGEGVHTVETLGVCRDGSHFPVEVSSKRIEFEGKEYAVSFSRDITERKLAEQSLRDSESRYRHLFELEADAHMLVNDEDYRIIEANEAAVTLYGYSREELLTMSFLQLSNDPELSKEIIKDDLVEVPLRWHRKKDGTVFPVEGRSRRFAWHGHPVHVLAIRDITERRRGETELEESRRMLRQVLDTVPLRISWRDRDLRYLGCNIAVALDARLADTAEIVGLRDEDLPWGRAIEPSRADDLEIIATGIPRLAYEETMSSGAVTRIMRTSKVPLRDSNDEIMGVLSVREDVTDRVRTLEVLREREEQLRQAQKMEAVGRLAGGIAHDFNNVLTTIIGYSDLLLSAEEYEPQSLKEDLAEIKAAAERAGNLTRQILAFSRRQALQPQVLLLNTVIEQTQRLLTRTIGADIELKTDLSPELGLVEVDEHQFVQILLNLAVNARDAMPHGGTLLLTTRNVDLDEAFCRTHADCQPGKHVLLSVSDTGCGMDADTAAHVFEPFYTTKAPGQGTGLGLSTVYGVVAQSGGTITLESQPGHGTTFHIHLPRFDHPALESEGQALEAAAASDRPTVLVVDDDATFRTLITRLLEKRGYRVIPVGDGDRAVEILKNPDNRVDLLLSDIVLPGSLQGGQIGQVARSLRPRLPVLYMSAYTRDTIVQAGRIEGSADFLEKPFTAESLANAVKRLLETR
ncbi:MAG: PAS domain S-box protein [Thermoleophilia bacterium]|nr:PAS domain S-box protein [Thermoleophilia bacterium]